MLNLMSGVVRKVVTSAFVLLILTSCENNDTQRDCVIRLSTLFDAIDYAPYVIAKKNGWIQENLETVNCKVVHEDTFQTVPAVNEAFASDALDGVMTAEVPTIAGMSAGLDVSFAWLSATLYSQIAVHPSAPIYSFFDLKNRQVGVAAGTGPHYGLLKESRLQGFADEIEIFDFAPPEGRAAFLSNTIDAWAVFPPFIEQQVVEGKARVIEGYTAPVQIVFVVKDKTLKANSEALGAIISALEQAKAFMAASPDQAKAILAEDLQLNPDVVAMSWDRISWSSDLDQEVRADIQDKANFLYKNRFISNEIELGDNKYIEKNYTR